MRFAVICRDKPDSLHIRQETRPEHLAYLKGTGVVEQAGTFLDEDGKMIGSLVILTLGTRKAAENWAANDPYAKAELFQSVTIQAWNKVIG